MRLIIFFLAAVFICKASAQSSGFTHFGVEDGLPQSQVSTISQDNKGRLWIGTMSGLARFDGRSFTVFNVRSGLAEGWITTSVKDKKGNIWLGHWGGAISLVKSDGTGVVSVPLEGIANRSAITDIVQCSDSMLWFATAGEGLFKLNINRNKAEFLTDSPKHVNDLFLSNGKLYVASQQGVFFLNNLHKSPHAFNLISDKNATAIIESGGRLIAATSNGIVRLDKENTLISDVNSVNSFFVDSKNRIWASTSGMGVIVIDENLHNSSYGEKEGLNFNHVNVVFEDKDNSIWIGTNLGLNLFSGERIRLFGKSEGLSESLVWSVLASKNGNILAGTSRGVFEMESGSKEFKKLAYPGLGEVPVISLFESASGDVLVGTRGAGLVVIRNGRPVKSYGPGNEFPLENILSISEDLKGNIWVGTDNGAGCISPEGKITWYTEDNGLGGNYISSLQCDATGRVWFAIAGGKLTSFAQGVFKTYGEADGLSATAVLSVKEDRVGNLWFGTYGDGLFLFDGSRFKNIPLEDGTNSDSPLSLAVDEKNRIWIGTNRGVDRFDPVTRQFEHFGRKKGFTGVETNINAVGSDRTGSLWYGTLLGVARISTYDEPAAHSEPVVSLDGVRIHHEDAAFPANDQFTPGQEHLTFLFSAVDLKDPAKLRYQYFLEGFDKDWSAVVSSGEAVYSNLPPGNYKLMIKAGSSDGVWTKVPFEYSFSVIPPYYRTWWFNGMLIFAVVGGLLGLIELRTRKLRKSKKQLELLVRERTIELGQKNMELAKKNRELSESLREHQLQSPDQ